MRKTKLRVGICDDDLLWCGNAENIIYTYGEKTGTELETVCFANGEELEKYAGDPIDVLFIDIELDSEKKSISETGIGLAAEINRKWKECQIVYLTNYLTYATEVYNTKHIYYVLKEQFADRVGIIFEKIFHKLSQKRDRLFFDVIGSSEIAIAPEDILCFERNGRVTRIHTVYGCYNIWDKISVIEERLPDLDFIRCHNSYIIYLPAVREFYPEYLILNDGMKVVISRSYRRKMKNAFARWALTQMS